MLEIVSLRLEIKGCKRLPEGHNERLRLSGLDAQLAAAMGEKLLLMQQLQGAMPALCATHELCLSCSVYHTRVLAIIVLGPNHSFRCEQLEAGERLLLRKQLEGAMPRSLPSMICVSCRS